VRASAGAERAPFTDGEAFEQAEPSAFFIDVFQGAVPAARRRRARKPDVEKGRCEAFCLMAYKRVM